MNTKNILSTTILAIAGIALSTVSAHAVSGTNFAGDGDLTIQFRGSGTYATTSYVIDLGSILNYLPGTVNGAPGNGVYSTGSLVNLSAAGKPGAGLYSDLLSTFGGSLAGVTYSLAATADGTGNLKNRSIAISSPETTVGTAAPFINNLSNSNANSTQSYIQQFQAAYAGASANGATTATGEVQSSATFATPGQDYAGSVTNGHVLNFPAGNIENTFGSLASTVSDLYLLNTTTATTGHGVDVGAFGFDSSGNLNFDSNQAGFPVAVPEPASAGAITSAFLGCASLFGRRRRAARSVQA